MKNKNPTVIDLFCGCGGLSKGFETVGYEILLGIDNWIPALNTFLENHPKAKADNADLLTKSASEILDYHQIDKNNVDIIIGGPPCQGFSVAGKRNPDDPRNKLYKAFVDFVEYIKPKSFVMENVPNLAFMDKGNILKMILKDFETLGYIVNWKIVTASNHGVPQNRKRLFIIGTKNKKFEFPTNTHGNGTVELVNAKEAISDLPENDLVDGDNYLTEPMSEYQTIMRLNSKGIFNHQTIKHSDKTISIINLVPDGGNYKNLPPELQQTRKVNIAWTRLASWKPSFTIDTGHNHHFHYKYNRAPTVRESARIQSFPDTFIFSGTKAEQLKQVGNAVPPLLASAVAKKLVEYIGAN